MVTKEIEFQPISNDEDGEVKQRQFFIISSRRHNLPSKVRLCNNQTARDVYMSMQ